MVYGELKKLRIKHKLTLKALSIKVGYGTGNLSSYENGKIKAKDETFLKILTHGYGMSTKEAKNKIAVWRSKELAEKYNLKISQNAEPYNGSKDSEKTIDEIAEELEDALRKKGASEEIIKKFKQDISFYKNMTNNKE